MLSGNMKDCSSVIEEENEKDLPTKKFYTGKEKIGNWKT